MAYLKKSSSTVTKKTEKNMVFDTPALGTPSAGVVTNLSGVLPSGVTGGSGLTALGTVASGDISHADIVYPAGHILKHQYYGSTTGVDYNGTTETVHTPVGNPCQFTKLRDQADSKLQFLSYGKMFDSIGYHLSCSMKLRLGTDTTGTELGACDAYDLFHSHAPAWRTGRFLGMYTDECTDQDAGTLNFVITFTRHGYSEPQHLSGWCLTIFEVAI